MVNVLKKIPVRKALREKGKSACIIAAVFFTTVLFVTVFSTVFFSIDSAEEMMRANSPILADAAISLSGEQYERVRQNPRVAQMSRGIRLGLAAAPSGMGIQLFTFEEQMAQWMRYVPSQGRLPAAGNEIVVSDQYLRESGLSYPLKEPLTLTYYIEDMAYTESFTVVGVYEMAGQPLHVILTSDDFYRNVCNELERRGLSPGDATYLLAGIQFSSRTNLKKSASLLIADEQLTLEEGQIYLAEISLLDGIGSEVWAAIICLLLFLMMTGYLFISNIFRISISTDARFYGKLATSGVTKREIKRLIRRQNRILFLIAAVPALITGYAFSCTVLPGILNANTNLQARPSSNALIFVLALAFSYATVKISERGPLKLAKNASAIELKTYTGKFRRVKTADNKSCLCKLAVRHVKSDRAKVFQVCVSIALGILFTGIFYTITAGFDEEIYAAGELDADFLIAKEPVFTNPNLNLYSYERTLAAEIAEYKQLPGIKNAGGGSSSHICLYASDEVWDAFVRIAGEDCYSTPGEIWTEVYGLDDMLLETLNPLAGEIDWELLHTGDYILTEPILGDDNTAHAACYGPGDQVTIPFMSGAEKIYTVMAVVEELPYSLSLPSRYYAGNLYLPRAEWQKQEQRDDYYLYAFNVEASCHGQWDDTLARATGGAAGRLAYRSAKTVAAQAKAYTNGLRLAGFVLCMIFLSMGILNFINCTVGSIYNRRRELAILESMGLGRQEILKLLAGEGMLYMAGGCAGGILLALPGVYFLIERVLMAPYIKYEFHPFIYLLFAAFAAMAALFVPWTVYRVMDHRESFLARIRSCRE